MPDVTISLNAANAARLQSALEESLELVDGNGDPRSATLVDAKAYIITDLRQFVKTSERRAARAAAEPTDEVVIT